MGTPLSHAWALLPVGGGRGTSSPYAASFGNPSSAQIGFSLWSQWLCLFYSLPSQEPLVWFVFSVLFCFFVLDAQECY